MRSSYVGTWAGLAALAVSLTIARTGRAEGAPQKEQVATSDSKSESPRGGPAIYGAGLAMKLSDIPLVMYGGGVMGVRKLKADLPLRLEFGGELLLGHTEAGLEAAAFSGSFGVDFGFSIVHVAPSLSLGVLGISRASASSDTLFGFVVGGGVRVGPEFRFDDRNRLAIDLLARCDAAGDMALFGLGGALRYGFF